ncbi:hypothetical protein [Curtobacterium sp. MCSS17_015]|uniref:hypothetical protein n=1 Tax=Curtobacterium sp. MCSS17_015 TaxID=2175666 RepID=UPI000DAAC48B|nr:hypothetical protein [Curtobacterium sp. MCSS17_015]WIB27022.1 hypothetical protein DEJ18_02700 [Curtobacterium sp. MCSS17_015]
MRQVFATTWQRLRRAANNPLLLAQAFSSVSGALAMVIAVGVLTPQQFAIFSLLTLISSTSVGLVRASLTRPALFLLRTDPDARVPFRYGLTASVATAILSIPLIWALGVRSLESTALVTATFGLPVFYDWLRSRFIAADRRWHAALGDAVRLLALGPVVLLQFGDLQFDAAGLQAIVAATAGLSAIVLWSRLWTIRIARWTPYRAYRHQAHLQFLEFAVGQLNSTIPMFVLGGLGASQLVGGFRFAQTLLGPMNLIFAATSANFVADGATRDSHRSTASLLQRGRQLSTRLIVMSAVIVAGIILTVRLLGINPSGVQSSALQVGVLLVGLVAISSGWAGIQGVTLRLLGHHALVTTTRALLVAASWIGFVIGFVLGGVDASLVAGFAASAVCYPLILGIPAARRLRKIAVREPSPPPLVDQTTESEAMTVPNDTREADRRPIDD